MNNILEPGLIGLLFGYWKMDFEGSIFPVLN